MIEMGENMDKKLRSRTLTVGLFFTLFFLALIVKIYWVQVVDQKGLMTKAQAKWEESRTIPAKRGIITDRNGKVLAEDGVGYIVTLSPVVLNAKDLAKDASEELARVLSPSDDQASITKLESKIYNLATLKTKDGKKFWSGIEIQNEGYKIDSETKDKVNEVIENLKAKIVLRNQEMANTNGYKKLDAKDVGVYLTETQKRSYPYTRLASHVLGFIDKWGKPGGYGLEASLNDLLEGTAGKLEKQRDPKGVEIPNGKMSYEAPVDGKNVTLTLDQNIQYYVENALRQVYDKWHPRGVSAIAANPKTGEILAMANMPDYDPNRYWEAKDNSVFRNNAVSYTYEPGSTFKVVTLAGAVEEKQFNPNETYQSGSIVVSDRRLHDHNGSGWGKISYMEGLLRSSNVAFVKLGIEKLGQDKLGEYISNFGFGQPTGIDLPGEQAGVVRMRYKPEFATATYGQGLTVTAIQQLASFGAIANGGKLMKPYIVKEVTDPVTREVVQANTPTVVRQVVSEETAKEVALDLEQAVSNRDMGATGWRAYIDGYRVAGKTGTANIVVPGEKGYAAGKWLISFAGFAPVEDPKIVVVVVADIPDLKQDYHLGGEVASPAFKEIVSQSLSYLGVTSEASAAQMSRIEKMADVPDTIGQEVSSAKTTLSQFGLKAEVIGSGESVLKQIPIGGTRVAGSQRVYLMTQEEEAANVPNLTGKSLRDALEVCSLLGLKCKTDGEGFVVSQTFSGDELNRELELTLKPPEETNGKDAPAKDGANAKPTATPTPKTAATSPPKSAGVASKAPSSGSGNVKATAPPAKSSPTATPTRKP